MRNSIFTDLSKFGYRELIMAQHLLKLYAETSLPTSWYDDEVQLMFNAVSGSVFLTNSEYQTLVERETQDGSTIDMWHYTPYAGHEGFGDELAVEAMNARFSPKEWHEEDLLYIHQVLKDDYSYTQVRHDFEKFFSDHPVFAGELDHLIEDEPDEED